MHFRNKCSKVVPTTTKGQKMNSIRLTRRGKIVLAIAILATFWALINAITPDECKVDAAEMSAQCKSLVFS